MGRNLLGPLVQEMAWNNDDIDSSCGYWWRAPKRRKVAIGLGHKLSESRLKSVLESDIGEDGQCLAGSIGIRDNSQLPSDQFLIIAESLTHSERMLFHGMDQLNLMRV
jgi:hypothetical protein